MLLPNLISGHQTRYKYPMTLDTENIADVRSTHPNRTPTPLPELWMILRDRKRLATIMAVQNVSHRKLAEAAGWRAHSYLGRDRKSTRLNSSHVASSYAVFCLKRE